MDNKKYMNRPLFLVLVGSCALLLVVLGLFLFLPQNPLKGRWNIDDVTVYEFGSDNKGALLLPSAEYEFTYAIKEDVLHINFVSEEAKDASYAFSINEDTLTLEGGNATTQGTYILKKVK